MYAQAAYIHHDAARGNAICRGTTYRALNASSLSSRLPNRSLRTTTGMLLNRQNSACVDLEPAASRPCSRDDDMSSQSSTGAYSIVLVLSSFEPAKARKSGRWRWRERESAVSMAGPAKQHLHRRSVVAHRRAFFSVLRANPAAGRRYVVSEHSRRILRQPRRLRPTTPARTRPTKDLAGPRRLGPNVQFLLVVGLSSCS